MLQKEVKPLPVLPDNVKYEHIRDSTSNPSNSFLLDVHVQTDADATEVRTSCILECYHDKELQCCGSCFRTLAEIAEAGKRKKANGDSQI